jgi:hypothetical protein
MKTSFLRVSLAAALAWAFHPAPARAEVTPWLSEVSDRCRPFAADAAAHSACWINNLRQAELGTPERAVAIGCLSGERIFTTADAATIRENSSRGLRDCVERGVLFLREVKTPPRTDKAATNKRMVDLGLSMCTQFGMTDAMLGCFRGVFVQIRANGAQLPSQDALVRSCGPRVDEMVFHLVRQEYALRHGAAPGSQAEMDFRREWEPTARDRLQQALRLEDGFVSTNWKLNALRACAQSGWESLKAEIGAAKGKRELIKALEKKTVPYRASVEGADRKTLPPETGAAPVTATPVETVASE